MSAAKPLTCEFAVRLPGQTADGRPLGATYGGDTATLCGEPAQKHPRRTLSGRRYSVVRCDEHKDRP